MGHHHFNAVLPAAYAAREYAIPDGDDRRPPDRQRPAAGGSRPPNLLTMAKMLADSLILRGLASRGDIALVAGTILHDPAVRDGATGALLPGRVMGQAIDFANEAVKDYLRALEPEPQPGEAPYRTAMRRFRSRIDNGQLDRVTAHVRAHFVAEAAEQR